MITIYGRMPVLEAVLDPRAVIEKVLVARGAHGEAIDRIVSAARERGVSVEMTDAQRVTRVSRNGRQDQGVVADIASPGLASLDDWLAGHDGPVQLVLLDGLTNPANVGQVIRSAVAAGVDGVILPRFGSPEVGPLVVKASAGIALFAPILRAPASVDAARTLRGAGVQLVGLAAGIGDDLWSAALPERVAFVFGNETGGVSPAVADLIGSWCSIPLAAGVDSLNVASAAAVLVFELARRRALG